MVGTPVAPQYPLAQPTLSGNLITVDLMLKEPSRITAYLSDITLQNFWADRVFSGAGGVSGGALLYSQLMANDLYTERDIQNVEPGGEFPIVTTARPEPKIAYVEKFGGKFGVTDEARDRNDPVLLQQQSLKLGNTINRGIHRRAIATLDASITAIGSDVQMTGTSWADAAALTLTTTNNAALPAADFAKTQLKADTFELGGRFNLWFVNPQEYYNFHVIYGDKAAAVLAANGVELVSTNRVAAGEAYVVVEGQVGQLRLEKPLSTETWREPGEEQTWVQASVRPLFAVTNPYNVLKVTGLAA
ncbi:major capsid protein [Nocardia sp. NPDC127579]|uniref:major capsid protein n=1 Tax=Nocardia sp. NPDC127579 TaxID=3345402 RepID=UPI003638A7D2